MLAYSSLKVDDLASLDITNKTQGISFLPIDLQFKQHGLLKSCSLRLMHDFRLLEATLGGDHRLKTTLASLSHAITSQVLRS